MSPNSRPRLLRHQGPAPCCRPRPRRFRPSLRLLLRSSLPPRTLVPFQQEILKNFPSGSPQEYSPLSLVRQDRRQAPASQCRRECSHRPRYLNRYARVPRRSTSASLRQRPELVGAVVLRRVSETWQAVNRILAPRALALHRRSPCAPRGWGLRSLRSAAALALPKERSVARSAILSRIQCADQAAMSADKSFA